MRAMERQLEETRERHQRDTAAWEREKAGLLRRLAEMRRVHVRDTRRIDDVLAAVRLSLVSRLIVSFVNC